MIQADFVQDKWEGLPVFWPFKILLVEPVGLLSIVFSIHFMRFWTAPPVGSSSRRGSPDGETFLLNFNLQPIAYCFIALASNLLSKFTYLTISCLRFQGVTSETSSGQAPLGFGWPTAFWIVAHLPFAYCQLDNCLLDIRSACWQLYEQGITAGEPFLRYFYYCRLQFVHASFCDKKEGFLPRQPGLWCDQYCLVKSSLHKQNLQSTIVQSNCKNSLSVYKLLVTFRIWR